MEARWETDPPARIGGPEETPSQGIETMFPGVFAGNSAKYPDNGSSFFLAVKTREYNRDIPAFGSRNEIFGTTNNNAGIHSTFCLRKTIAELARQHNKVNICELSDRFISIQEAEKIVDIFPDNKFEDGRQQLRPEKIPIK